MKGVAPLLGAGGTFAGCVLVGFGLGVLADQHLGSSYYTLVGLFAGVLIGGYGAARLLLRSL